MNDSFYEKLGAKIIEDLIWLSPPAVGEMFQGITARDFKIAPNLLRNENGVSLLRLTTWASSQMDNDVLRRRALASIIICSILILNPISCSALYNIATGKVSEDDYDEELQNSMSYKFIKTIVESKDLVVATKNEFDSYSLNDVDKIAAALRTKMAEIGDSVTETLSKKSSCIENLDVINAYYSAVINCALYCATVAGSDASINRAAKAKKLSGNYRSNAYRPQWSIIWDSLKNKLKRSNQT